MSDQWSNTAARLAMHIPPADSVGTALAANGPELTGAISVASRTDTDLSFFARTSQSLCRKRSLQIQALGYLTRDSLLSDLRHTSHISSDASLVQITTPCFVASSPRVPGAVFVQAIYRSSENRVRVI